jgi:hypothetical protein
MASILFRIHEMIADRFPGIQYPRQRLTQQPRAPFLKYEMSFHRRVLYLVFGLAAVLVSLAVLLVIGAFMWGVLTK